MFEDARSKSVIFVAHCILNQNSISDGTACYPGCMREIVELMSSSEVGIIQMPCPELHCLGLDRKDTEGSRRPVVAENTRIRKMLNEKSEEQIEKLADHVVLQIKEYYKHDFNIKGVVGMNRSPSCGVETTSIENKEVNGQGVFIEALQKQLQHDSLSIDIVGIKSSDIINAINTIKNLLVEEN